ncbi:hypothetical protein N7471_005861 [Penicillium samsonianum]|uniref:uncharacterized protein n=1 Tax=Penicillium samsonianum TaxID=1882272 RepID=UPI002547B272|nr:uncharacterized protein N7471_005861 [Penicillium samsonianum]KAJ6139375.1 hypothetical protein N7471_005861 [Penicillium samsonianum]
MEAHDRWENRIMRRAIIDRDKVAVVDFRGIKLGSYPSPVGLSFLSLSKPSTSKPNTTFKLLFKVLYLPHLYSSCLPAPATAAPASATPALVPAASSQAFTTAIFLQYNPYQTRAPTAVKLAGVRYPHCRAYEIIPL